MQKINAILVIALCLFFFAAPVIAAKEDQGIHVDITVSGSQDNGQSQNVKKPVGGADDNSTATRGTTGDTHRDTQVGNQENTTSNSRNISQLRVLVRQSQAELAAAQDNKTPVRLGWTKNENEVRLAVHTLLAMENFTGGIGPQVSAIAREFNNSANTTQRLEDRIMNRDAISRFFFGGDSDAATELANISAQNQNRIRQIQQIMNATTLDTETRTMMEEQLQVLQQQVTQEQQLSVQEKQDRGLLGWMLR